MDEGLPAIVGARVTIGHHSMIHGCVIEDDCLIGMGATLLSGARIGSGSLIAAGTLVKENQVIPPGMLVVGAPARVVGPVREPHRKAIANGAYHYAELAREYVARGHGRPSPPPSSPTGWMPDTRGPMSEFEWASLLATLEDGPRAVARALEAAPSDAWRQRPTSDGWNAAQVVAHLLDADTIVHQPRVERVLAEPLPVVEVVDLAAVTAGGDPSPDILSALEGWRVARARLLDHLRPLGPAEWTRCALHSQRGPFPLYEMVRGMVEHDLGHRRQIARALGRTG
jgi:hypothetical protein